MNLNDYYLVRAFSCFEYREGFNTGNNVYLRSASSLWERENAFQQDKEGMVFEQSGKGFLIAAKPEFKNIVLESSSVEEILQRAAKENMGQVLCETSNFNFKLDGYLCCFYLLPKSNVKFTQTTLSITTEEARKDIAFFLEQYLNESDTHDFYVSIYDAVTFCNIFLRGMYDKGYQFSYGSVKYKDIDMMERIRLFQNGDYNSIIFTKSTKYSYQKEFRIFLAKPNEQIQDHISESGIDIFNSILGSFCYNDILKQIGEQNG